MEIPLRTLSDVEEQEPLSDEQLPGLFVSLLPVLLPVVLIACNTIATTMAKPALTAAEANGTDPTGFWVDATFYTSVIGNPNFALMISTAIAMLLVLKTRGPSREEFAKIVEVALMSAGVIILITAAGKAFGEMLKVAEIGPAIQGMFGGSEAGGYGLLFLGFGLAALLKVAQGSSTAAMIVGSSMLAAIVNDAQLPFNTVYIATSIGAGSLIGSWMNDSGFWIFAKMGGLTETEALKSWTPLLLVLGFTSMAMTLLLASVIPLTNL